MNLFSKAIPYVVLINLIFWALLWAYQELQNSPLNKYKFHHKQTTKITTTVDLVFKMSILTACIEEI